MSMSDIAASIECALDDGFSYPEIMLGLQNQYGFSRAEALHMINQAVKYLDEAERFREVHAEASYN